MGEKVENAFFSHALGKVVAGQSEERRLAKAQGHIEIGNEDPHKHIKPAPMADYMEGL